jgi:hypothetical protein
VCQSIRLQTKRSPENVEGKQTSYNAVFGLDLCGMLSSKAHLGRRWESLMKKSWKQYSSEVQVGNVDGAE